MDAPTAMIVCGWVALWALWPHGRAVPAGAAEPPGRLVVLGTAAPAIPVHARPDLIVMPSAVSFGMRDQPAVAELALPSPGTVGVPRYLDRPRTDGRHFATFAESRVAPVETRDFPYGEAPAAPPFDGASVQGDGVHVWVSESLTRHGFRLPDEPLASLPGSVSASFEVELSVEPAADGDSEHVYVERSSGDVTLDRRIEAIVSRGRVSVGVGGTVVVSVVKPAGDK